MKDLVSVKTRSENLCFVRKKSLNWKQSCRCSSTTDFFIKRLRKFLKCQRNDWDREDNQLSMNWLSLWVWCEKKKRKKKKMMKRKWANGIKDETNSIVRKWRVRWMTINTSRLRFDSDVNMTSMRALMSKKIALMIVDAINCKSTLLETMMRWWKLDDLEWIENDLWVLDSFIYESYDYWLWIWKKQ
jgi:hypothetical protein